MRIVVRSFAVVLLAIVGAVLLALTSTMTSVFTFTAVTVLIMGGTGHPLSTPPDDVAGFVTPYLNTAVGNWVGPASTATPASGIPAAPYTNVAVITPEQFRFDTGLTDMTFNQSVAQGRQSLDGCINATSACRYNAGAGPAPVGPPTIANPMVVFGYSQSATIATLEKEQLAAAYAQNPASAPGAGALSFVLVGDPNRPNGGFLARGPQGLTIPIIGVTFSGPTPTNTPYSTVDIARQYDGWADGPENPLDVPADANAIAGIYYLHGGYSSVNLGDAVLQDQYGDTTYYLVPTPILPLLMPLESIPIVGTPLADTLDPPLRVLVEAGYDRTMSPGQPTSWNLLYFPNPIALGVDFLVAIPTGLDNGISDFTGLRPFGTVRPGPYGVGGPPVTLDPATTPTGPSAPNPISTLGSAAPQGISKNAPTQPVTIASSDPGPDVTTGRPAGDPGTGTNPSVTAQSGPSVPLVTKPSRQPIGATLTGPKNTDGRVTKVLSVLTGGPKAPSGSGSTNSANASGHSSGH